MKLQHLQLFSDIAHPYLLLQGVRNKEVSTQRGADLLGITYNQIYFRCFQTKSSTSQIGAATFKDVNKDEDSDVESVHSEEDAGRGNLDLLCYLFFA